MAEAVYVLCAVTSVLCAVLLARSYRQQGVRLLLWSTLCFSGLAINNTLLVIDLVLVSDVDLSLARTATGLVSIGLLLVGLIWEVR